MIALFRAFSLDVNGLHQSLIVGHAVRGFGDALCPAAESATLIAESLERCLVQYGNTLRAASNEPASVFPKFDISQVIDQYGALQSASFANRQLMLSNPGLAKLLANTQGDRSGGPPPRADGSDGGEGPAAAKKQRTDSGGTDFFSLTPSTGDKFVRRCRDALVWRSQRDGSIMTWSEALIADWQKRTSQPLVAPRLDAILSSKASASLRAANAPGADPNQVIEPKGWAEVRDRHLLPDFRLPGRC